MTNINNFKKSLEFTLKWEGGYVNDPSDPGGETKWGISKRAFPELDIRNLTEQQAADIYANHYWDAAGCDGLPLPLCTCVFDTAVNHGVERAVRWLRNAPDVDTYLTTRKNFYIDLVKKDPIKQKYLRGWLARVGDLQKFVELNVE